MNIDITRIVRIAAVAAVAGALLGGGPALAAERDSAQLIGGADSLAIAEAPTRLGFVAPPSDDSAALPSGDCSGVSACNDFIAECVGAGGDFVPGSHNEQGQPTSGSCGPVRD